ncbi:MAG: hypothetical protein AMXMBFR31_06720 [Candidatus Desulfobacillus denitrificans]|nr:YdcF family protein [Zoogloeaceae bacterium]
MFLLKKLLTALALPPAGPLLLAALGLLLIRRRPRLGKSLAWSGLALLWLLATPAVTKPMLAAVEDVPPLDIAQAKGAQAIVVLGGGSYHAAPEYGGDTVSRWTLDRLRYAARLQRETGLPLLVTGGAPLGGVAEARSMRAALERDFGVKVRWVEDASADTRGNARFSAPILHKAGVRRVLLVTHAWHMRRAQGEFAAENMTTIAAPTAYEATGPLTALDLLPGPGGLWAGRIALGELLGQLVQRVTSP